MGTSVGTFPMPSLVESLWVRLTEPAETLTDLEQRRRAQLLASLLVFFIPLGALSVVLQGLAVADFGRTYSLVMAGVLVLLLAYALSRTTYFILGAAITVAIPSAISFINVLANPGDSIAFAFSTVSVLLGSMLFTFLGVIPIAVINLVGMLALPLIVPELTYSLAAGPQSFVVISTVLLLVFIRHRDRLEADRQAILAQSEARYRMLVEQAADGIFLADTEGRYLDVNESGCGMLGFSREEILKKRISDLIPIEDLEAEPLRMEELLAGKTIVSERRLMRKDGDFVCTEISARMLPDGTLQGIVREITDRKRAEKALEASESRFRTMVEQSPFGTAIYAADGRILLANQAFAKMWGVSQESSEYLLSHFNLLQDEQIRAAGLLPYVQRAFAGENVAFPPALYEAHDPESPDPDYLKSLWVEGYFYPVVDEHDQVVEVVMMQRDVTERIRAQRQLEQRAAQLELISEVGRRIAAALDLEDVLERAARLIHERFGYQHVGLFTVDKVSGELLMRARAGVYASRFPQNHRLKSGEGIVGWVAENGERLLAEDVSLEPRFFNPFEEQIIQSELTVPIQAGFEVVGVLDVQSQERSAFTETDVLVLETLADQVAIAIENARLYEALEAQNEILENRVAERTEELQAANEHLKALTRLKDEFVASVSHELRTPITSLKLYHDLLVSNPKKAGVYLETLQRETERLAQIIESLLDLSWMDRGEVELSQTTIDLNEMVAAFMADRPLLARSKGLGLTLRQESDLRRVRADEGLLGQVLSILLTNAINYTPAGGHVVVSTVRKEEKGAHWVGFRVSDTGPGIQADEKEQLMDRFFRGRVGRDSGVAGTGLGLAIAKEIVSRHEGRIEVESQGVPGKGAAFTVWLPAERRNES